MTDYLERAGFSEEQLKRGGYTIRTTLDPKATGAAKQAAEKTDAAAQTASANAQSALAAADEAKRSLRRDAESLLPERFTSPDGPVKLTFAFMSGVLTEETAALHTAQAECSAALRQAKTDCTRRDALENERQTKAGQRPALEQAASEADSAAAAHAAKAGALEQQAAAQAEKEAPAASMSGTARGSRPNMI